MAKAILIRFSAGICIALTVSVGAPTLAYADSASTLPQDPTGLVDRKISDLQEELELVSQEELDTSKKLDDIINSQNDIAGKIKGLDSEIKSIQQQVFDAQDDYKKAQAEYERLHNEYLAKKAESDASILRVRLQAADLISGKANDSAASAALLLSAESIQDLGRREIVMKAVADFHKNVLDEAIVAKKAAELANEKAEEIRNEAEKKRNEIALKEAGLQAQRMSLSNLNKQAQDNAKEQAVLLEKVRGQKVDYQNRIVQLQNESGSISELLRKRNTGQLPGTAPGQLGYPISNPVITSSFGMRVDPVLGGSRLHAGTDFAAQMGAPVMASAVGTIAFSGQMTGYGNVIIIDHGGNMATLYAHQSVLFGQVGDVVTRGEVIGLAGSTGYSTGPHVHFEVRISGTPVDPIPYLVG